ncbi:hypothetical protein H4S07_004390 [Coemansia furcata]|uniref:Uncharacterized protein n=1 Tax=Coemansia furcata TaxID=417177 RepID=A0ACC1LAJ7_9FUNG|nr:hypothetical protein H4S07_004390 [Coemansia furcata]
MVSHYFYSFLLSATLLLCMSVPVTAVVVDPVNSKAPKAASVLGGIPLNTSPPTVTKGTDDTIASPKEDADIQPKALRRRWYPYGGYGYYPYYQYYPYGGGGLDLELRLGLHL